MSFNDLLSKAREYLPPEKIAVIESAYQFAMKAHEGQLRKSGEPYLEHPLHVATTLAELQLDSTSLAAALLHDVPEDCAIPLTEIQEKFGPEVAKLVDGVTKLGKVSWRARKEMALREDSTIGPEQAENLRKMLLAMAVDLRVVFIKLADRLHNMLTLDALSPEKRRTIAQETMEVYAPLAHRLGIWELKWQLEDLSFRYLDPRRYHQIEKLVTTGVDERDGFIKQALLTLRGELDRAGLKAEIYGRPKHIFSIQQKIGKYAEMGKDFDDIHDLLALRVLVDSVSDCYVALGIVHNLWRPLPDQFDDYIANPKPNGYQSLHTTVMYMGTTPLEIQIRTHQMHSVAEYGVAAHWRYKEGEKKGVQTEERLSWLRQLVEWHRELSGAEEFLESVKTDIFIDQVFVYTPKGDIKDLPKGATPLDFAYRIHTNLGHRCVGAKVNGRLVSLNHQLINGDMVEILTSKTSKGPSRDWLNPVLGYVKTSDAMQKIRQWFKKLERTENIERGREMLDKMIKQLGLKSTEREKLARLFKYENLDDFYANIGYGSITTPQIVQRLALQQQQPKITVTTPPKQPTSAVKIEGVENLLTRLAECCHPLPGDLIVGYITRNRGVTIHRADCHNIVLETEKDRLINAEWGDTRASYPVNIQVQSADRVGLVRDITTLVAEEKININSFSSASNGDGTATTFLTLETENLSQLNRILTKLESIREVISASRVTDGASPKESPTDSPAAR
jgi:guanosine-3',5'-bis(diphosphate) 3'-pyrophosphohydrolase